MNTRPKCLIVIPAKSLSPGRLCWYFKVLSQNSDAIVRFSGAFCPILLCVYCGIFYRCCPEINPRIARLKKPVTLSLEGAATEQPHLEQRWLMSALKYKTLLNSGRIDKRRDATAQQNWKQSSWGGILLLTVFSDAHFSQSRHSPFCTQMRNGEHAGFAVVKGCHFTNSQRLVRFRKKFCVIV